MNAKWFFGRDNNKPSGMACVLALVVALMMALPMPAAEVPSQAKPVGVLQTEHSFQDYTLRIYRDNDTGNGSFEILRAGKQVYIQQGYMFQQGNLYDPENTPQIVMGSDITGQGVPNLVVGEWTGGAHCCYDYNIFEIGERFKKIATLEANDSENARFLDLNGDGKLEFEMADWTFAYWSAGFVNSPAPALLLRYQQGEYRLAADLMRRPPPAMNQLTELAQKMRSDLTNGAIGGIGWTTTDGWIVPSVLWGEMLDLIYSGNMYYAFRLMDLAWPSDAQNKSKFLEDFLEHLATSPYYAQVMALNQPTAMPGTNKISAKVTSTALRPEAAVLRSVVVSNAPAVASAQLPSNVMPVQQVQPRLSLSLGSSPALLLFGVPGSAYRIESSDDLLSADGWHVYERLVLTDNPSSIPLPPAGAQHRFFRVVAE